MWVNVIRIQFLSSLEYNNCRLWSLSSRRCRSRRFINACRPEWALARAHFHDVSLLKPIWNEDVGARTLTFVGRIWGPKINFLSLMLGFHNTEWFINRAPGYQTWQTMPGILPKPSDSHNKEISILWSIRLKTDNFSDYEKLHPAVLSAGDSGVFVLELENRFCFIDG